MATELSTVPLRMSDACCAAAIAERPAQDGPSHARILLALAAAGLTVFAAWQVTGVDYYLNAFGGYCL